ncbi:unnamed protein product [Larinioides sclopetarius]|uniref:Uncharacterized protein n=1 Tax=Larinioides sclopetarius TaxID=280406 RepID=A0AAV2ARC6_9ARAC
MKIAVGRSHEPPLIERKKSSLDIKLFTSNYGCCF